MNEEITSKPKFWIALPVFITLAIMIFFTKFVININDFLETFGYELIDWCKK